MTFAEIRATHPFPWRHAIVPDRIANNGCTLVVLLDAQGGEVPLFVALEMLVMVTSAKPPEAKQAA